MTINIQRKKSEVTGLKISITLKWLDPQTQSGLKVDGDVDLQNKTVELCLP